MDIYECQAQMGIHYVICCFLVLVIISASVKAYEEETP